MKWNTFFKTLIPAALFLWGSYCMLKSYGYCDCCYQTLQPVPVEEEFFYEYLQKNTYIIAKSTEEKIKDWQEKYDFHMFHAKRTYEDAKNKVWWLPDISWRQRGREAWVAAWSTVGSQTLQMKLLVALGTLLCQYGLDCLDEWEYIEDKLYWSKFHLQQCEIYAHKIHG